MKNLRRKWKNIKRQLKSLITFGESTTSLEHKKKKFKIKMMSYYMKKKILSKK